MNSTVVPTSYAIAFSNLFKALNKSFQNFDIVDDDVNDGNISYRFTTRSSTLKNDGLILPQNVFATQIVFKNVSGTGILNRNYSNKLSDYFNSLVATKLIQPNCGPWIQVSFDLIDYLVLPSNTEDQYVTIDLTILTSQL